MEFPRMFTVRQVLQSSPLEGPEGTLEEGLERARYRSLFSKGDRVAVAVGSRKIDRLSPLVEHLVGALKDAGCEPFIIPAMGSHGGATPEGQAGVLAGLGITEDAAGAPVISSMDTIPLGVTDGGATVFIDKAASAADAIVVVNRVAPHTGYSGTAQSGLQKMLAVGLGKSDGALSLHGHGFGSGHLIVEMAGMVLEKAPVAMGIALVEDGEKKLSRLEVLPAEEIPRREPGLLDFAIATYPRIPVSSADVLIVEEMGKNISGIGMDPLVTGRGKDAPPGGEPRFEAKRVVVLRLTEASGGNATGVGHADIITETLYGAIDHEVTRRNVVTSGALHRARVPLRAKSDRDAVATALESLGEVPGGEARVVRIRNTGELGELQVSVELALELQGVQGVELAGGPVEMIFDRQGNIL